MKKKWDINNRIDVGQIIRESLEANRPTRTEEEKDELVAIRARSVAAIAADLMDDETQSVLTIARRRDVRELALEIDVDAPRVARSVLRAYVALLDRIARGAR